MSTLSDRMLSNMNLNDLAFVVNYIITRYSELQIPQHYSQLITLLNEPTPTEVTPLSIEDAKVQLIQDHAKLSPTTWSFARTTLFKQLGAEDKVGGGAAGTLSSIFSGYSTNGEPLKRIQALYNATQLFIEEMSKLKASLGPAGEYHEEEQAEHEGKVLLEIVFDGDVNIKTITELQKQSRDWELIISSYQRLVGNEGATAEIAYLNKINPTILGLWVPPMLAEIFKRTVNPILDVRNNFIKGQIAIEELRKLKLDNYVTMKEDAPELLKTDTVLGITNDIVEHFKPKKLAKGETPSEDVSEFIKHNTEEIFDFIVKGGRIDVSSSPDGGFKASFELAPTYERVKEIETESKKLLDAPAAEAEAEPSVQPSVPDEAPED